MLQRVQSVGDMLLQGIRGVLVHAEHRQGELSADRSGGKCFRCCFVLLKIAIGGDDRLHQPRRSVAVQVAGVFDDSIREGCHTRSIEPSPTEQSCEWT